MDFVGILKEAWDVTWRNRALWILGLFVTGGASVSTFNYNLNGGDIENWRSSWTERGFEPITLTGTEIQRALDDLSRDLNVSLGSVSDWVFWLVAGAVVLLFIGLVFAVLGIAARGGLVHQVNEALSGRKTSASAGWRSGFRYFWRLLAVSLLLALPGLVLASMAAAAFFGFGGLAWLSGGEAFPGLIGMGMILAMVALAAVPIGIIVSMLREVSIRHAVLGEQGAVDAIKATWSDLWKRRGVASMWLVMTLVYIVLAVVAGIILFPLGLAVAMIVAGTVVAGGLTMLWLLVPASIIMLAAIMLVKAVFSTFTSAAWTSFYARMERPDPVVAV